MHVTHIEYKADGYCELCKRCIPTALLYLVFIGFEQNFTYNVEVCQNCFNKAFGEEQSWIS